MSRLNYEDFYEESYPPVQSEYGKQFPRGAAAPDPQAVAMAVHVFRFLIFALVAAVSIWVYGLRDGLIVSFLVFPLVSLPSLLGLIPIFGPILYWFLAGGVIIPQIYQAFPTIEPTWLISTFHWLGLVSSISYSLAVLNRSGQGR